MNDINLNDKIELNIQNQIVNCTISDIWISIKDSTKYWLIFNKEPILETTDENITIYHRSGWKLENYINKYERKIY